MGASSDFFLGWAFGSHFLKGITILFGVLRPLPTKTGNAEFGLILYQDIPRGE